MPFIDAQTIDDAIGAPARNKITGSSVDTLNRLIAQSDARAQQDLKHAGYSIDPDTSTVAATPYVVQHASIGYFLKFGLGRMALLTPEMREQFEVYMECGKGIKAGEIVPEGLEPDPADAVGGVSFSESDESIDGAIVQQFSIEKLSSW